MILGIAGLNDQNDGKHGIRIEILDERMMYINNFFFAGPCIPVSADYHFVTLLN